jgi:DNA-binding HxlR family transcriptional regulator
MTEQVRAGYRLSDVRNGSSPLRDEVVSSEVFVRITDKWSMLVINALADETLRFTSLRARIGEISHKMLTMTLRGLESDGFVSREIYATIPPRVEYSLTDLGREMLELLDGFCFWTHAHVDDILLARARFSERQRAAQAADAGLAERARMARPISPRRELG